MTFQIIGLMDKPRWKSIPCICHASDISKQYPILESCLNCKFQHQEDQLPKKSFKISLTSDDKRGKTKSEIVTCNKIKINRGDKYQEILGWFNIA